MKKSIFILSFFACLFCFANQADAQKNLYDNSLYTQPGTGDYLRKVDNMILGMSKKLGTMNDQERKTYRRAMHGDTKATQEVIRSQNAKSRRYDAANQQYSRMYGKSWAKSFNTFNSGRWVKVNGTWQWVK